MTFQISLPPGPPFDLIEKYAQGKLRGNLILEGPPGVGKSTLARHIMQTCLTHPENFSPHDIYNGGKWESSMLNGLENSMLNQRTLFGEEYAYSIIDEFDLLSHRDMFDLRARHDRRPDQWGLIMTTNHLGRIPEPIQSRSEVISVSRPSAGQLLVAGRRRLDAAGVDVSPDGLRNIATACDGDFRKMERAMDQVIASKRL